MKVAHHPILRLNAILHRRTQIYFDRQLKPHGLSFTHFRMLAYLAHNEGPKQEDVRAFIDADKGGVAHSIKRLVEKGYVARERDPQDKRAYTIRLTDEGRTFFEEFASVMQEWTDQMVAGFSAEELELAEGFLRRMAENACALLDDECEASK